MTTLRLSTVLLSIALAAGCGRKEETTRDEMSTTTPAAERTAPPTDDPTLAAGGGPGPGPMMEQMSATCPMVVEGAKVEVADTATGVALTFTTDSEGDVADLRERARQMAAMYESHGGRGGMMWHRMGRGMGRGMGAGAGRGMGAGPGHPMPAAKATVTEVDKGARVELVPTDAAQLDALREHMRFHQQRMSSGECWMAQDQGSGTPP